MPRFFTWNTQGSFDRPNKLAVIRHLMTQERCVVGLIQEGGRDKDGDYGLFTAFGGNSVGAFNDRCTNYVLVNNREIHPDDVRPAALNAMGGGVAARTAAAALLPLEGRRIMAVSWHSAASANNEDTSDLLRELDRSSVNNAIIGGDFNSESDRIDASIARRRRAHKHAAVVAGADDTHDAGNIDYFVFVGDMAIEGTKRATCLPVDPSDHDPVVLRFSIL